MVDNKRDLDEYRRILQTVENILENGSWRETRFLMAVGKQLLDIRQKLINTIQYHESQLDNARKSARSSTGNVIQTGQILVYISLYNAQGTLLEQWAKQLQNIRNLLISRPIYAKEADARAWIRSRPNDENEAYAAIYIHPSDIIPAVVGRALVDKVGNELIQTRGNFTGEPVIDRFYHRSGVYTFTHHALQQISAENPMAS